MPTFQDAYVRLMRIVNRPLTEIDVLDGAKDSINDAVDELQRDHAFCYSEAMASFDYPASTFHIDLGIICDGTVRDFIYLQEVQGTSLQGRPIKFVNYGQLQADRYAYYRTHSIDNSQQFAETTVGLTIEDAYRQDMVAFIIGKNIGLYPTPSAVKSFLLNFHVWLPRMVATGDSNFFLTHAYDVVMMLALKKMHIYMKSDDRYPYTEKEVETARMSLIAWDGQVIETPHTQIR